MQFRLRILLALVAIGVTPVLAVGALTYRVNREELLEVVGRAQAAGAEDAARECERLVVSAVEHLDASSQYLPLRGVDPSQVDDILRIPFRQLGWMNIAVLLSERGTAVGEPVFDPDPPAAPLQREPIGPRELDAFSGRIPLATALGSDVAIGQPYPGPRTGVPRVAIAVRVDGTPARVLAAEVSLREFAARLDELAASGDTAYLVDERGQVISRGGPGAELSPEERGLVEAGAGAPQALTRMLVREDGRRWLASFAPVATLGWGVVLARPEAVALRAATRAGAYTLFWAVAALLLALAVAWVLARGLTVPIAALSGAARALTEGRYADVPPPVVRRDELGEFAAAFHHMAREVARRDEEIRSWNAELTRRVEEKASALRAAQDQVSRSRRLAAVGSLAAGVAHEINNPLTAVIGLVAIVRKNLGSEAKDGQLLGTALEQATRVARVVEHLREISERQREGAGVRFSLSTPVQSALEAHSDDLAGRSLKVTTAFDANVPEVQGDPVQIQALVEHLLQNAVDATADGGEIRVHVSALDGEAVQLSIADSGHGIPARIRERIFDPFFTDKQRGALGLGLTLSNCIVEAHHGKLVVDSEEGKGSVFTVLLPAAAAPAHLA